MSRGGGGGGTGGGRRRSEAEPPAQTSVPELSPGAPNPNHLSAHSGLDSEERDQQSQQPQHKGPQVPISSLTFDNGVLNIKVPCAYTYPLHAHKLAKPKKNKHRTSQDRRAEGSQQESSSDKPDKPVTIRLDCSSKHVPFCSTVRSHVAGPPSKGYIGKTLPPNPRQPKGQNKTKMKWDYEADIKIPVRGQDYGQELFETAARNFAIRSQMDKIKGKGASSNSSKSSNSRDGKCPDFSTPAFNSSLKTSNELATALEGLNNLPLEIERIFKTDKRFEPIIMDKASRALNIKSKSKVFKDLVPVEPSTEIVNELWKGMVEEVESVRPVPRSRDPEPSLLDFQEPSFSRMKPKPVPPPTKPTSGLTVPFSHSHHLIQSETKFQQDGNKM